MEVVMGVAMGSEGNSTSYISQTLQNPGIFTRYLETCCWPTKKRVINPRQNGMCHSSSCCSGCLGNEPQLLDVTSSNLLPHSLSPPPIPLCVVQIQTVGCLTTSNKQTCKYLQNPGTFTRCLETCNWQCVLTWLHYGRVTGGVTGEVVYGCWHHWSANQERLGRFNPLCNYWKQVQWKNNQFLSWIHAAMLVDKWLKWLFCELASKCRAYI